MKSLVTLALSLVLTASVAAPAFAHEHGKSAFPMKADVFQQKVESRLAQRKARLEKRIAEHKIDEARAKQMRERFEARAAKIRAAVAVAIQDGVVTKEEAKAVRQAGGGHHHHRHHRAKGSKT